MTDDSPKTSPEHAPRARVETTVRLEAEEDRVLRALHGSTVAADFPLPQKDDGLPAAVKAQLRKLEEQAFVRAGRVSELQAELAVAEEDEARREEARAKIVAQLRGARDDD